MSIRTRELKDGRKSYYAVIKVSGTQRWIHLGHQPREAKRLHDELVVANNRKTLPQMSDCRFSDLVEKYFRDGIHDLREQTILSYRSKTNNHLLPFFGELKVRKSCGVDQIQQWITFQRHNGVSDTSIRAAFTPLSAILSYAAAIGLLYDNPCRKVRPPKQMNGGVEKVLSPEQVARVITNTPKKNGDRLLVQFLFSVGCRGQEASELRWRDISWSEQTVCISRTATSKGTNATKNGKSRTVPLAPSLVASLSRWKQERYTGEDGLVFPSIRGSRRDMGRFARDVFRPALVRSGLSSEVPESSRSLYLCRKSMCSILLGQGVPAHTVSEFVGNSPTVLLKHYARSRSEDGRKAMVAFDAALAGQTEQVESVHG